MSYLGRPVLILVAFFSLLLLPLQAQTNGSDQAGGSRIKHFFARIYCHVFPCRHTRSSSESSNSGNRQASTASSASTPATSEGKEPKPEGTEETGTASAPTATKSTDTSAAASAPPAGKESATAPAPGTGESRTIGAAGGVVVLEDGQKPPERKHPEYEDWGSPYLPSVMKGDIYLLGKIDKGGFTRELVHVQWREMDPIDLWVIRPSGVKKPPAIIYVYGFPDKADRYKDDAFCESLVKDGFAAVGFATALNGQRLHDRPGREWFVSQLQESVGASVHDVQMIVTYLEGRKDFDMSRVGIWGVGSGASIAIVAAAVDPRIKAIDVLNPWGDWPDWLAHSSIIPEKDRPRYLVPSFQEAVKDLDPVGWLPLLKGQKVRLQYILEGMTVTGPEVRKRMEAAAPANVEIVNYQNSEEFTKKVDLPGKRFDWIHEQLGTASEVRKTSAPIGQDTTKSASSPRESAVQQQ